MLKKKILLGLLLILISSLLSAEGQNDTNRIPLEDMGFTTEGMPIVKIPVDIEMLLSLRPQMESSDSFTVLDDIAAEANVNIDINGIPMAIYTQKKQLMLASLDFPDVFWGADSISKNELKDYGDGGYILELSSLIDQYMPNLKKFLDENPLYREKMKTDEGKMYYLPSIFQIPDQPLHGKAYINKKWLDKLGLPVPRTLEEYTAALRAFKESDPNGNGKQDEIPLVLSEVALEAAHIASITLFFGSFGRTGNGFTVEDGKIEGKDISRYIFGSWFPNTSYELGIGPDIEKYDSTWPENKNAKREIWIPIKNQ